MKSGRYLITLVLGAVVLVGCQQESSTNASRLRWAGEMETVDLAQGIAKTSCLRGIAAQVANPTATDFDKCVVTTAKDPAKMMSAMAAGQTRGRMFYTDTTYTYLYLPYYYYDSSYASSYTSASTYLQNYTQYGSGSSSSSYSGAYQNNGDQLCKLLFGRKCWRNDWYSTYIGYQPQQTAKYYNPACSGWLNTGVTYAAYSAYSDLNNLYGGSNWNQYSSCYNVYY